MTARQTQKVRRQMRAAAQKEFKTFLKTMTPADFEAIVARMLANRRGQTGQEAQP